MSIIPFQEFTSKDWQIYYQSIATTQTKQPYGQAISMAVAAVKDYLADRIELSIKSKFPLPGYAPTDALIQIGEERGIYANPGETDLAYAVRLLNAWLVWPYAGTNRGILRALYDAGYPNAGIVQQLGGWYTLDGNQNLLLTPSPRWLFDSRSPLANPVAWLAGATIVANGITVPSPKNGFFYVTAKGGVSGTSQPTWPTVVGEPISDGTVTWQCKGRDFWSRFAVILFAPFPTAWGGTPPVNGSSEQLRISALIKQWKSAHSTCVNIVVATAGALWGYHAPMTSKTWGGATAWRTTWGQNCTPTPTYWTP